MNESSLPWGGCPRPRSTARFLRQAHYTPLSKTITPSTQKLERKRHRPQNHRRPGRARASHEGMRVAGASVTDGKRVMVAMSGGVDSSVAAAMLLQQGYHVEGMTMRLWREAS